MSFISNQTLVGQILSYAGLSISLFTTLLGRHYSRTLYFAQLLFIFSTVFPDTTDTTFSLNLSYSWITFIPSFLNNYCTAGDYICTNGYLITAFICYIGGAIALLLVVKLLACKFKSLQFLKVYAFYRGLSFWFVAPLWYVSIGQIIQRVSAGTYDKNFQYASGVAAALLILALVQLIAAKVAQREEQNIWRKWIEFFCHLNLAISMLLVALYKNLSQASSAKYLLNIPLVLYFLIFLIKYKFTYKVVERISVALQDIAILIVYNVFTIKYYLVPTNNMDFYGLVVVLALEFLFLLPKLVRFFKNDEEEGGSEVNPEKDLKQVGAGKKRQEFAEADIVPNESFQGLRSSQLRSSQVYATPSPKPPQRSPPKRR